jgi:hypothetical protein
MSGYHRIGNAQVPRRTCVTFISMDASCVLQPWRLPGLAEDLCGVWSGTLGAMGRAITVQMKPKAGPDILALRVP